MLLKEYLIKHKISAGEFAKKFSLNRASIYAILKGTKPQCKTAKKIEEATNHEVTFEELRGIHDSK